MPLAPDSPIRCEPLHATVPARCCVKRQLIAATGRTKQLNRGQGTMYPSCDGCAFGEAIRDALDPERRLSWRGSGPGHRFERERRWDGQQAARERLEAAGRLDPVPTIDGLDPVAPLGA